VILNEKLKTEGIPAARIYFPPQDRKEILERVDGILQSGQLTLGKYTKEFEGNFASYLGVKYTAAVNSGTSAIEIPLRIFDVVDREVIVPTNTFAATAFAVIHAGGRVKFADMDETTHAISLKTVKKQVTSRTKVVISVHVGGAIAPDTEQVEHFCQERGLIFFEDAAHAQGSKLDGKFAGTFGKASSLSFYPTKVITSGEGGMVVTDDEEVYKRALVFRDQGKSGFAANLHTEIGYNWRLSEIQAVLGLYQLARLDEFIAARRKVAKIYDQGLEGISGIHRLSLPDNSFSNYYKYIAVLDRGIDRKELKQTLKQKYNVSLSGEVYELPLHFQPVFSYLGYKKGDFPIAEDICSRQVCLPVFATMSEEQAHYVLDSLKEVL